MTYVAHAHNDYLQLVVELGLPGALLVLAFLTWWVLAVRRVVAIPDVPLSHAAAIASGVVLLHSAWDYPIRTAAIGAVFAMCCVLIARSTDGKQGPESGRFS